MKKLGVILAVLITILICFSGITIALSTGIIERNNPKIEESNNFEDEFIQQYIQTTIDRGSIEIGGEYSGNVNVPESAIKKYTASTLGSDFELFVSVGDCVSKEDKLFSNHGKVTKSTANGRVLSIDKTKSLTMLIFSYDESSIIVYIPEKYQNLINNKLSITATDADKNEINVAIKKILPSVEDNNIAIELENQFNLFSNSSVKINIIFQKIDNCIIINKKFVRFDSDKSPYVQILKDDNIIEDQVITIKDENSESYVLEGAEEFVGLTVVMRKEDLILNDGD